MLAIDVKQQAWLKSSPARLCTVICTVELQRIHSCWNLLLCVAKWSERRIGGGVGGIVAGFLERFLDDGSKTLYAQGIWLPMRLS